MMNRILKFLFRRKEEWSPICVGDLVTYNPEYEDFEKCKKYFDTPKKVVSIQRNNLKYAGFAFVYVSEVNDEAKGFHVVASALKKVKS